MHHSSVRPLPSAAMFLFLMLPQQNSKVTQPVVYLGYTRAAKSISPASSFLCAQRQSYQSP
jgi:hypothetical protein